MMETKPNILLITIDCGRQDMIYGDEVETPNLDKLKEKGIIFTNAFSQSSTTIPSIYSLFTGKYLSTHGVITQNPGKYKSIGNNSLPVILDRHGWKVGMFSGLDILEFLMIRDIKNCVRGKEDFHSLIEKAKEKRELRFFLKKKAPFLSSLFPDIIKAYFSRTLNMRTKTKAETLVDNAISWLSSVIHDKRFFLWVHFFDAHLLYWAPDKWINKYYKKPRFLPGKNAYEQVKEKGLWFPEVAFGPILKTTKDMNFFLSTYRAALSYIDEQLGRLTEFLKDTKRYENTFVILTADHGENLVENGIYCGHSKLFDHTTKIPLILRDPDMLHLREVSSLVQHIDIMPTLLERFQINISQGIDGRSLGPCIGRNEEVNEFVFSEHTNMFQKTIRNKDWQYLWANPDKRYPGGLVFEGNVLLDRTKPDDTTNYASLHPALCKEFEALINKLSYSAHIMEDDTERVSEEQKEKLQALGYME